MSRLIAKEMDRIEPCYVITWREPYKEGLNNRYKGYRKCDDLGMAIKFVKFLKDEIKAVDIYVYESFELDLEGLGV